MEKITNPTIEQFINNFRIQNKVETVDSFMNGNCYYFALILKNLYPHGTIEYDTLDGHFIYHYLGKYYDVYGCHTYNNVKNIVNWETYSNYDINHYIRILRDCIYKCSQDTKLSGQIIKSFYKSEDM